jgi:crossover junction endodeoxyribonuclease RusA
MGVATMTRIVLPWPAKELSPNARGHWAKQARFKKGARELAGWTACEAGWAQHGPFWEVADNLQITITFCPPDKRRRDLDNAIASFKASQDGIADALGIDDSKWAVSYRFGEVVKGGRVLVELNA